MGERVDDEKECELRVEDELTYEEFDRRR